MFGIDVRRMFLQRRGRCLGHCLRLLLFFPALLEESIYVFARFRCCSDGDPIDVLLLRYSMRSYLIRSSKYGRVRVDVLQMRRESVSHLMSRLPLKTAPGPRYSTSTAKKILLHIESNRGDCVYHREHWVRTPTHIRSTLRSGEGKSPELCFLRAIVEVHGTIANTSCVWSRDGQCG